MNKISITISQNIKEADYKWKILKQFDCESRFEIFVKKSKKKKKIRGKEKKKFGLIKTQQKKIDDESILQN